MSLIASCLELLLLHCDLSFYTYIFDLLWTFFDPIKEDFAEITFIKYYMIEYREEAGSND